jgi:putative ABC transport system permease protein
MNQPWRARRIPLAWLLLTRQPARLAVALVGIALAGLVMFIQLGLRDGLFDSSVTIHRLLAGDLVMISPRTTSSIGMESFPGRRLVQSMADPDVEGITPVHWNLMLWKNPLNGTTRSILVLGYEPGDPLFNDPSLAAASESLTQNRRVLFDSLSRSEFGPIAAWFRDGRTVDAEVSGKRVRVVGLVELGASFGADGNLITSRETFHQLLPDMPAGSIDLGLIRLRPGVDPYLVARRMMEWLPDDVRVFTREEFEEFEKDYWRSGTAIGFIFTFGAAMGFVVGCVIVYQILYSDVNDHLSEYATLIAMGYRLSTLLQVVAREGLLLALMGYVPAWLSAQGLYAVVRAGTRLPVMMDEERTILVFGLILAMCMGSAALAMRKLADADPAEIF